MRSNEVRLAAVKRRAAQMKRQQQMRQSIAAAVSACLVLIAGLSAAMPAVVEKTHDYAGFSTTASIFTSGTALGYWVIGMAAFVLGVCVTILCVRLQRLNREKQDD